MTYISNIVSFFRCTVLQVTTELYAYMIDVIDLSIVTNPHLKDIETPTTVCWKTPIFQWKKKQQQLNNIYHLIANLLLLWMISRWFFVSVKNDFSGQAWKCKGFPVTRRYWCRCDHCLLIYKTVSQFFEILILSRCFWANVNHAREIIFISSGNLINAFYLPSNRKRNLRHGSVEER